MTEIDERIASAESGGETNVFDLVLRGYDRRQVDDHLQNLLHQLAAAEHNRQLEQRRADHAEAQLAEATYRLPSTDGDHATQRLDVVSPIPAPDVPDLLDAPDLDDAEATRAHAGFGLRLERLLRAADHEAAETRESAVLEARALVDQARADIEAHWSEMEQALAARTAELDQWSTLREAELNERERELDEQSEAAYDLAEQLLEDGRIRAEEVQVDAQVAADRIRATARQEADELHTRMEQEITERWTTARAELRRLRDLRLGVRDDLGRMLQKLAGEFERPPGDAATGSSRPRSELITPMIRAQDRDATADDDGDRAAAPDPDDDLDHDLDDDAVRLADDAHQDGGGEHGPWGGVTPVTALDAEPVTPALRPDASPSPWFASVTPAGLPRAVAPEGSVSLAGPASRFGQPTPNGGLHLARVAGV